MSLPTLIQKEIYDKIPKAKDWKLGKLHEEWNDILLENDIINIKAPRSHLKTFFFFEAYALMLCKFNPNIYIKYITSNDTLAKEKLSHIRQYAELPYFKELLEGADTDSKTQLVFSKKQKIDVSGFGSKIRGGHPDVIILDDIIDLQVIYSDELNRKTKERFAMEVLPMCEPHTKVIIIGTIQRDDDLYSIDLSKLLDNPNKKYINKSYDAVIDEEKKITLFPEKWNWDELMSKKREVSEFAGVKFFNKEYRNMATNLLGEIIDTKWYQEYTELPENIDIYTGWDLSVGKDPDSGDYTAKVTVGIDEDENIYIIDVYHDRIDFGKRIKKILSEAEREKPTRIAIENNVFQADTVQVAKQNCNYNVVGVKTTINKVQKYNEQLVPLFENRRVFFKKGNIEQEEMWRELCSLPRGSHDDMSDALCIAIKDVLSKPTPEILVF